MRGQVRIRKPPLIQPTCETKGGFPYEGGVSLRGYVLIVDERCKQLEHRNKRTPPARRLDAARAVPMNIDSTPAQMTVADCLHLTALQQLMAESSDYTQEALAALDEVL